MKKERLLYGVGKNDAAFSCSKNGRNIDSYAKWYGMLTRCYSKKYISASAYEGCKVTEEWLLFTCFHDWFCEQEAPDGWHIDKDILVVGNLIYAPENCVIVEPALNYFLSNIKKTKGNLPMGVKLIEGKYYLAKCRSGEKEAKYLGLFKTPQEAHAAYKEEKWRQAQEWIEKIKSDFRYKKKEELCNSLESRFSYTS